MNSNSISKCATCGTPTHIDLLDAKPSSVGPGFDMRGLTPAQEGENWERLECFSCYGPSYVTNRPELLTPEQRKRYNELQEVQS
jgi:hypothetical protein